MALNIYKRISLEDLYNNYARRVSNISNPRISFTALSIVKIS